MVEIVALFFKKYKPFKELELFPGEKYKRLILCLSSESEFNSPFLHS